MASVFLSYDRDDGAAARIVATALEKAGHSVWWDLHVRGGAQFAKVIEEALKAADVVVVLWSANSIESTWVCDEAAVGRDSKRLVPATIEGTQPPLGFRQFQTIELSDWKRGSKSRGFKELKHAIDEIAGGAPSISVSTAASPPRREFLSRARRSWLTVGVLALVLLSGGLAAWLYLHKPSSVPVIAVVPADHSAGATALARDLLIKLGSLWSAKVGSVRMTGEEHAKKANFVFQVAGNSAAPRPAASLMFLAGQNRSLLWSQEFEQQGGNLADLRQQAAVTAARVLGCTLEGLRPKAKRLPEAVLKQYLNACALLEETWDHDPTSAVRLLQQVTRQAPDFEPAWAKLLVAEVNLYQALPPPQRRRAAAGLRRRIADARKVNGRMPEAYVAEIELLPGGAFLEQGRLADKAVQADPQNVPALNGRSMVLLGVGRQDDAVNDASRATELDPLSPATRNMYIQTLTYSGRTEAARQELVKAEKLWPGASTILEASYRFNLRCGDPKLALQLFQAGTVQAGERQGDPALEAFLIARIDPTKLNIERALELVRASYRRSPDAIGDVLQSLGEFHRKDELFDLLLNWNDLSEVPYFAEVLFRPALADLRADPRFMIVARRFGLVDYWSKSGHWPDFCFEPDLPYDCKAEAAKLTS